MREQKTTNVNAHPLITDDRKNPKKIRSVKGNP